jgi:hypothetical protein
MTYRTPTLAEWPYPMVRLACDYCPRRGQYRKETLLSRFAGDVLMPDVRHLNFVDPVGAGGHFV